MTDNKIKMCDKIIKELGHENPATIFFIKTLEENPNATEGKCWALLMATLDLVNRGKEVE